MEGEGAATADRRAALQARVALLGEQIKALKMSKEAADGPKAEGLIAELKETKAQLAELGTDDFKKFELKTPKGTRDYGPFEMAVREKAFEIITRVFKRHGAVTIDTPVFELKDVLTGKYGEDSKLIYDLQDQGGELCALRYDLTVPFARFLAMNTNIKQIKRYHIGKVYRRDQPQMNRGRFREFYQCDCDIAGVYERMVPDAEVVRIMREVLSELQLGQFVIKINHRKLLDGIFEVSGVPEDKFRTICSAVDKLDKLPWAEVRKEMTEEKGLSGDVADKIGSYVQRRGTLDLLQDLLQDPLLTANKRAKLGLDDMALLLDYLGVFGALDCVSFDLSLARGLDYYTGVIYEAVLIGRDVGSIAGGGRYDDLVGMFDGKGKQMPCVGFSVGIERVFTILEDRIRKNAEAVRVIEVEAYIVAIGELEMRERMALARTLWDSGVKCEFSYKRNPKVLDQLNYCEKHGIPLALLIGGDEVASGIVKIKAVNNRDDKGAPVARDALVAEIRKRLEDPAVRKLAAGADLTSM